MVGRPRARRPPWTRVQSLEPFSIKCLQERPNGSKNDPGITWLENLLDLDLLPYHLSEQRAQRTCVFGMFVELFADTGAKERCPDLKGSLTKPWKGLARDTPRARRAH